MDAIQLTVHRPAGSLGNQAVLGTEMELHHLTHHSASLPISPYSQELMELGPVPGSIDGLFRTLDGGWRIAGWMMPSQFELSSIHAYINGQPVGIAKRMIRPDLEKNLPWVPHARRAGFEIFLQKHHVPASGIHHLDLIGYRRPPFQWRVIDGIRRRLGQPTRYRIKCRHGEPIGRYHTLIRADLDSVAPSPPAHLMKRVVGHQDLHAFKVGGMKLYGDFLSALSAHRDPASIGRLLDWGCGCGRATVHFLHHPNRPEVHGCDIDGEAIAWCRANLHPGQFEHVAPMPPLPYPDAHFDVIISCSVLSHLKRDVQHRWLAELSRVLKPGGLLLPSFHGLFAAAVAFPPEKVAEIRREGIVDHAPDHALRDVIEDGYYGTTVQTREYTMREWSKHLDFVGYLEAGMHNYQDLAVLRKK